MTQDRKNAADKTAIAKARKQERFKRRQARDDLTAVLETPEGRRLLWKLLGDCHVFTDTYSPIAMDMARAEGRRLVGTTLLHDILDVSPDYFVRMITECSDGGKPNQ